MLEETQNMVQTDGVHTSTANPDTVEPAANGSANTAVSASPSRSATAVFRLEFILTATIGVYLAWKLWQKFV